MKNFSIEKVIKENINEVRVFKETKRKKIFRVVLDESVVRLDVDPIEHTKWYNEISRLQTEAYRNKILVAKVIVEGAMSDFYYKISEWIEGASALKFQDNVSTFVDSGKLLGRMNTIKVDGGFLTNSDFYGKNILISKDLKIYMIDVDALKVRSGDDLDHTVVKSILLWTGIGKGNIIKFLEGYSVYRNPIKILEEIEKRNWVWRR